MTSAIVNTAGSVIDLNSRGRIASEGDLVPFARRFSAAEFANRP